MFSCLKNNVLAIAVAGALIAAGSASAFNANDGLDGAWFDKSKPGEGIFVDVLTGGASPIGSFAYYTYGDDNKPTWLLFATPLNNGKFENVDVSMYMGDKRDTAVKVGKATGGFESCSSLKMSIDMNDGTGLKDVTIDYATGASALGFAANPQCSEAPALASCPEGTTADGEMCKLPSDITADMYLPAGKDYKITGAVMVKEGAALTIAPGVTLIGGNSGSPDFLAVLPGAKIFANGTESMPITFKGPSNDVGSWAGLVIAGNSTCNDASGGAKCEFEAIPGITYGGDDLNDSSGSLTYVRVQNAGQEIAKNEELNSFTFLGVGAGTKLSFLQANRGADDGFEFFGGSANADHLVCTNMSDDCLDLDQGYSGNIQFALVYQGDPDGNFSSDPRGIEADNDSKNFDKKPRTSAKLANVTLVGSGLGSDKKSDAIHLRRGFGGQVWNTVATGYLASCLKIDKADTFNNRNNDGTSDAKLAVAGNWIGGCTAGAIASIEGEDVAAWYNAGPGNKTADSIELMNGYLPKAGAGYLTNGQALPAGFIRVPYSGAFAGPSDDWTKGWTLPFVK